MKVEFILCIISILGGLVGMIWCFVIINRSIDSEDWEQVDCLILLSRFEDHSGDAPAYRVVIEYKYSVGGATYIGNRVRWRRNFMSKSAAHKVQAKYSMGATARVSIDPNNPNRSVLIPGVPPAIYHDLFLSGLFIALPVVAIIAGQVKP